MSTPPMARAPLVSLRANEARRWFLDQRTWIRVGTEQSGGSAAIVEHLIPATAPGFPPSLPPDMARLARLAAEAGLEVLGPSPEHRG
jgi:hypothetical protein